jgi:hypothetical protein
MAILNIKLSKKRTLKVFQMEDPFSPREDSNLTRMICFHNGYDLGDQSPELEYSSDNYNNFEELEADIVDREKPLVILPLYMYDHSGITISTTPFTCAWDSGQIGFVFIRQKEIDELGCYRKDNQSFSDYKEELKKSLISEVNTYDMYLTGDVYSFHIQNKEGDVIDSCAGFYGTDWKNNGLSDYLDEEDLDKL